MEAQAISTRATTLSGAQYKQRTNDRLATAAAVVIFWPAAFVVGGDKPTAAELARMKGQIVAPQAHQRQACRDRVPSAPLRWGSLRMCAGFTAVRGCVAVVSIAPGYVVARAAIGPGPPEGGETEAPISDGDMSMFEVMPGRGVGGST
jgi:hypothetical protein